MTALLEVTGLRVTGPAGTIVDRVDFGVEPGHTLAIVGESGSGKSMTVKALTGLLPPGVSARGSLTIAGRRVDLAAPPRSRQWRGIRGSQLALLLQDPFTSLSPVHRCGDQIGWALPERADRRRAVANLLAEVRLDSDVATKYPFELSGGMRQRVAIAAGLAANPAVLLADEPTTALDVTTQRDVLDLIADLQGRRDMGLVLITHDLGLARDRADQLLVMYAGRQVEHGSIIEVATAPAHPYTARLIGCDPPIEHRLTRLPTIAGSVPLPQTVGDECAFVARCELAVDACRAGQPPLVPVGPGHASACIRWADTALPPEAERFTETDVEVTAPQLLRIRGLTKRFHGGRTAALAEVDLDVARGECVAVVGESGSGKTTLARCVVGLETPSAGRIEFGSDAKPPRRAQIVFQDPYSALNPAMSVGASLREALRVVNRPATDVDQLLTLVGLPAAYARRRPVALSGGERQRVAIARALATEPELLILDESVSALDVSVQAQVLNLLADLRDRLQLTLLFITHDLAVARQVAQRIYVMHRGRVVEQGTAAVVLTKPRNDYTIRLIASIPTQHAKETL